MGQVCGNVNRTLKWAFVETANLIVGLAGTHVVQLYQRIKRAKNHQKAVVAVGRHLAEAAWWVLTKQEVYREPRQARQLFRRRTGKRGYAASPRGGILIATPSPVEQALADIEGGDMCPAKDWRSSESGTDERPSIGKERLFWGLCP